MTLVILEVNGRTFYKECVSKEVAKAKAVEWLDAAKKSFPHVTFVPVYYNAKRLAAD